MIEILFASALVGQGISYSKLYLFHIMLVVGFFKEFKISSFFNFIKTNKIITFLSFFPLVSLLWVNSVANGIHDVAYAFFGFFFLYVLIASKVNFEKLYKVIQIVFWVNIIISIFESFDIFRYPLSQFSHIAVILGKTGAGVDWGRTIPTGFYFNPNNNAFFVLVFAPLVLTTMQGPLFLFTIFISTFVIFMASSKVILVGWIFFLGYILVKEVIRKYGVLKASSFSLAMVGLVFLMFTWSDSQRLQKYSKTIPSIKTFLLEAPVTVFDRLSGKEVKFNYLKVDISLHERLMFLNEMAGIVGKNWLLGAGAGSLNEIKTEQAGYVLSMKTPHFYLLEIMAKYGLVFFGLYLFWLGRLWAKARSINKLYGVSLLMFAIFSPVMSSAIYFLPKWALYGALMKVVEKDDSTGFAQS